MTSSDGSFVPNWRQKKEHQLLSFNKSNNSRQQLHSKLESTYMCVLMSLITPYYYYYYINIIGDELLLIFAAKFQRLLYIVVTICLLIG